MNVSEDHPHYFTHRFHSTIYRPAWKVQDLMYDSYENVSERFGTFTYFVRTFLTYLSTDLRSTRNIERSVSSNRLPKRLVLVIHGAV